MVPREVVDEEALRAAHPEIAKEYDLAARNLERARNRDEAAVAAWLEVRPNFTTVRVAEEPVTKKVRENLTVTAPKIKETNN
jgi:hypothetical protein